MFLIIQQPFAQGTFNNTSNLSITSKTSNFFTVTVNRFEEIIFVNLLKKK